MPDGLYERDALAWAERQAGLLRRLAAGEKVNAEVDWANVIEEVQDVGLSELRAVESLLERAMLHLLKIQSWPRSSAAGHWRAETIAFLRNAKRRYTPSMQQRIDVGDIFSGARQEIGCLSDDSGAAEVSPEVCPWTLAQLLDSKPDPSALAAMLAPQGPEGVKDAGRAV